MSKMIHWKNREGHWCGKRVSDEEYDKIQKNAKKGERNAIYIFVVVFLFMMALILLNI